MVFGQCLEALDAEAFLILPLPTGLKAKLLLPKISVGSTQFYRNITEATYFSLELTLQFW
jgi:hypothetical protein